MKKLIVALMLTAGAWRAAAQEAVVPKLKMVAVFTAPSRDATALGFATAPESYPVLEVKEEWIRIKFYSGQAWIKASEVTVAGKRDETPTDQSSALQGSTVEQPEIDSPQPAPAHLVEQPTPGLSEPVPHTSIRHAPPVDHFRGEHRRDPSTPPPPREAPVAMESPQPALRAQPDSTVTTSSLPATVGDAPRASPDSLLWFWIGGSIAVNIVLIGILAFFIRKRKSDRREEAVSARPSFRPTSAFSMSVERYSMQGEVGPDTLIDLFQFIAETRKTGCLTIDTANGPFGEVYFEEGTITHASTSSAQGQVSIDKILALDTGSFRFHSGARPKSRTTGILILEALMNHAKARDESGAGQATNPVGLA